ncbi:MAG: hypothetical protein KGI75_16165 [Rhizobiaceae bacterium]|nr:hypothetical protein [Rhizobiaceae bacterium]
MTTTSDCISISFMRCEPFGFPEGRHQIRDGFCRIDAASSRCFWQRVAAAAINFRDAAFFRFGQYFSHETALLNRFHGLACSIIGEFE